MKRNALVWLLILLLPMFWLAPAQAQEPVQEVPTAVVGGQQALADDVITYQGLLRNGSSVAVGIYDFQFSLYDALTGGTQIGSTISVNDVSITYGTFTAELNFGEGRWTGEERWLEIAVKADVSGSYTTLIPRQEVTPAPQALSLPGFWTYKNATSPNLIGGYEGNSANASAVGQTISGGGAVGSTNLTYDNYATIGGGASNRVGSNDANVSNDVYSTVGGGLGNTITQEYATIGGGQTNSISAAWAVVSGGINNSTSGRWSAIGGGNTNTLYDDYGTIGGGASNVVGTTGDTVGQPYGTVGGGQGNSATEDYTTVSGGRSNTASDLYATVGGGYTNVASDMYATIGGGYNNLVSAEYGTVGGGGSATSGNGNEVYDNYGTVGGGTNNVAGVTGDTTSERYATVGGGTGNSASENAATVGGGTGNSASGSNATVGGGTGNSASANRATVGGGSSNIANNAAATVAGGDGNTASATYAFVGGGQSNQATNRGTTVGGGISNTATGDLATAVGGVYNDATNTYSTVVGGIQNQAAGAGSFIGGGQNNNANSTLSAILGGSGNTTLGEMSVAAGQGAVAAHDGTFVWASKQEKEGDTLSSTAPGQFIVRAPGGVWFGSSTNVSIPEGAYLVTEPGAYLTTGGTWANASDRALKTAFAAVDGRSVLAALATIPVQAWSYRNEGESVRHIGPTAQDFHAAFGLGSDNRHIATVDADGVALAAIQELNEINREQAAQITALETRLTALEQGACPNPRR